MKNAYIGIDPGASGYATTVIFPDSNKSISVDRLTNYARFHSSISLKNSPEEILKYIADIKSKFSLVNITIEDVHSIHGTSAKSNFNFGRNVGIINTVALLSKCEINHVTPTKWQQNIKTILAKDLKNYYLEHNTNDYHYCKGSSYNDALAFLFAKTLSTHNTYTVNKKFIAKMRKIATQIQQAIKQTTDFEKFNAAWLSIGEDPIQSWSKSVINELIKQNHIKNVVAYILLTHFPECTSDLFGPRGAYLDGIGDATGITIYAIRNSALFFEH